MVIVASMVWVANMQKRARISPQLGCLWAHLKAYLIKQKKHAQPDLLDMPVPQSNLVEVVLVLRWALFSWNCTSYCLKDIKRT